MKITLDIPDSTYEAARASIRKPGTEVDEAAVRAFVKARLVRWLDQIIRWNPDDRSFIVTGDDRRHLEATFQTVVDDAADLAKKTRNLASIQIGTIQFPLAAGDILRLREQASFHGWSPQDFVDNTCREICDYFMGRF